MEYSKNYKLRLSCSASVVTIGYVREILYKLGLKAYRDKDYLVVVKHPEDKEPTGTLYASKDDMEEKIGTLFVDEGIFPYTMDNTCSLLGINNPWDEVVDYESLLAIIVKSQIKEYTMPTSDYIGYGRRKSAFIKHWLDILKEQDWVMM